MMLNITLDGNLPGVTNSQTFPAHYSGCSLIAFPMAVMAEEMKFKASPYTFHTKDEVKTTLRNI